MVPPGDSQGGTIRAGASCSPLSRLLCFLSCRSKKGRPRWQALAESHLEKRLKGYGRVTMTTSKYHPESKPSVSRPLAPSVTCGDSSLPEGAMGPVPCHIGLYFWESAYCNPSVKNQRFLPAPFGCVKKCPLQRGLQRAAFYLDSRSLSSASSEPLAWLKRPRSSSTVSLFFSSPATSTRILPSYIIIRRLP